MISINQKNNRKIKELEKCFESQTRFLQTNFNFLQNRSNWRLKVLIIYIKATRSIFKVHLSHITGCLLLYEAQVRFGTQVRDLVIFEKVGCGCRCSKTRQLKNYKKYFYLYFLYIFTIKIFLKNTLLCLDSQKKERRRQVSAFPAIFKADFGRFQHVSAISGLFRSYRPQYGRYGPILAESAQFRANQSRFDTN